MKKLDHDSGRGWLELRVKMKRLASCHLREDAQSLEDLNQTIPGGVVLHRGLRLFLPASAPSLSTHHRPTHDLASASRKNKQDGDVHWQGGLRIALHVATLHWVSHFSTSGTQ